jgi:hypothetical protein
MVDRIEKEILTKVTLDADDALKKSQALSQRIQVLKQQLADLAALRLNVTAPESLESIDEDFAKLNAELADTESQLADVSQEFNSAGDTSKRASEGIEQTAKSSRSATREFSTLGNVANRVFRSIIGFIVLGILRKLIGLYDELVDKGREFARSIIDVSVAVRQLQRAGVEISQLEVRNFIVDLRKQFGLFTKKEVNAGIGALLILGEQLNFTKDQLFAVAEATAVAATRTGIDYKEAIDRVTRALATGQTRGLVELGFAISETAVKEEAYRLGLAETEEQLDRNTKAQALRSLLIQQSGDLLGDVVSIQDSFVGQLEAEEASVESLQGSIGNKLIPVKLGFLRLVERLLIGVDGLVGILQILQNEIFGRLTAAFIVGTEVAQNFWNVISGEASAIPFSEIVSRYEEVRNELLALGEEALKLSFDPALDDEAIGTQQLIDNAEDATDEVAEAYEDLFIKLRESIIDGNNAIEKENRSFLDRLEEDLLKFALKVKQLSDKLAFDRAKIQREFQRKVADLNRKARDKEIDAEEKFRDKLRQLQERFLLDLQDALQERDAKQILRLIRNFNQRKRELERQRDDEKSDIEEDRKRELEDLQRRRDDRLAELDREFAFRRQKLQEEFELERQLAQLDHEQKLREIRIQTNERNAEIIRRFSDQYDITATWAAAISARLNQEFGPGGVVDQIYAYMLQSAANTVAQLNAINAAASRGFVGGGTVGAGIGFSAGTGGLETDTPVDTNLPPPITGLDTGPFTPAFTVNPSEGGTTTIEVLLSPDLEAGIIDKTKDDLAEVFVGTIR